MALDYTGKEQRHKPRNGPQANTAPRPKNGTGLSSTAIPCLGESMTADMAVRLFEAAVRSNLNPAIVKNMDTEEYHAEGLPRTFSRAICLRIITRLGLLPSGNTRVTNTNSSNLLYFRCPSQLHKYVMQQDSGLPYK